MIEIADEQDYRDRHPGVLRIFDVSIDSFRDATQSDLDRLSACTNAYARLRHEIHRVHSELRKHVKDIVDISEPEVT